MLLKRMCVCERERGREKEGKGKKGLNYTQTLNSIILMDLFTLKHQTKINSDDGGNQREREKHCVQ